MIWLSRNIIHRSSKSVAQLSFEDIVFPAGGGFLFGVVAGYTIRKLIKLAAIVVGMFVVVLSYLSYKGWLDVKWIPIENTTKRAHCNFSVERDTVFLIASSY
jgi:uncharacterized membrane protein (Fun14 family)